MAYKFVRWIAAGFIAAAYTYSVAQEPPPMLLDEKPEVKVWTRERKKPTDANKGLEAAVPTPAPEDVIIAIVDGRVMTRADLETRVSARYQTVLERVQSQKGGIVAKFGPGSDDQRDLLGEREILQEQEEEIKSAMRQEEADAVQEWVEFSVLAEEARRQGIVISDSDFRARLEQLKKENRLDDKVVSAVLEGMKISNDEFEKYVYDALMIEGLSKRFIDLNYTDEYLRSRYDATPHLFYQPERFRVAHFSMALDENARNNKKMQADMQKIAQEVRSRLKKNENPEELFSSKEFNRMDQGYYGDANSWYTFRENILPPIVEYEARKLKVGETSDVLINRARDEDENIVPISFHVLRILESEPETGKTFESAMPAIRRSLLEVARTELVERLRNAGTHKMVISMGGIRPDKIPTREALMKLEAEAQPINLKVAASAGE